MLHVLSTQNRLLSVLSSLTSAHFNYARQLTAQVGCGSVLAVCCRFATYPDASNCCKLGKHMMTEMLKSKQHTRKLICSSMGARMDSEPKSWRILGLTAYVLYGCHCLGSHFTIFPIICLYCSILTADVLYDLGTALEVVSPLCPQLFLEVAGLGNFAKGMVVVAARATRLPIYSSFAKEGNLSDLFAKGEAISTLFNVMGIGAGIGLASTVCSTTQGKVHICRMTYHRLSYHYSCSITPSSGKYTQ
ncbi:Protein root UVB sensitive 2 chloroplastic [Zea mays]|uniref:Protein root UVB sensitive 2 chloroplastic n=1 Tax=Zea mays TaxID=4577 RepID=A0A1D6LGH0_MAIZE|nr:Protein root UVB sensitive 2 chloroplastic [Zea mays]